MRHLETQTQREEREKKRGRFIGYFLLAIMVVSTAGYALLSYASTTPAPSTAPDAYGRSPISVNGQTLYLTYPSKDLINISITINTSLRDYVGNPLYVSTENPTILYEISSTLGKFVSKMQEACYGPCTKNLPEKNCTQPVIIVNESEELKVSQEDQCIFIQGDLRSADAFLYRILSAS